MRKVNLDPYKDRDKFKERIVDSVSRRIPDADRSEINMTVEQRYEYWLSHSNVKQHIPTITEHQVTAIIYEKIRGIVNS
jgi:hypothetical protein